jgi:hypothetical protein
LGRCHPRAEVAALPPWTVVHLHGARTGGGNDGWTENAVLPGNSQLAELLTLLDERHPEMWEMVELKEPLPSLPADGIVQVMLPGASKPTTLQRVGRTFRDAANFYVTPQKLGAVEDP